MESAGAVSGSGSAAAGPVHEVFFYEGVEEYVRTIVSFVRKGRAGRDPALIAVPGPKTRLLRALLDDGSQEVTFADMTELGRNPARIIAAIRRFIYAHPDTATRFVGEPIWPGRTPAEISEGVLHESLIDVAVAGSPVTILCPYDTDLDPAILKDAERTHTHVWRGGERVPSPSYDPDLAANIFSHQLSPAPDKSSSMVFHHGGLAGLRRFVEDGADQAGFASERLEDLLLAVNEVATNTLVHVGSPGTIRLWSDPDAMELICDLRDEGRITDLLAGRSGPYPVAQRGWGLWMVNQVCDLVEMRSGDWGTNIRLHMRLD
jgi:anti-sigma regulatory factor (Ser/Thr protein kinase)